MRPTGVDSTATTFKIKKSLRMYIIVTICNSYVSTKSIHTLGVSRHISPLQLILFSNCILSISQNKLAYTSKCNTIQYVTYNTQWHNEIKQRSSQLTLTLYTTRPVVSVSAEWTHCLPPAPKHYHCLQA